MVNEAQLLHDILIKGLREGISVNYEWYPPYNDLEPFEKKYGIELSTEDVEDLISKFGRRVDGFAGDYVHMYEAGYNVEVWEVRDPVDNKTYYAVISSQWDSGGWGWSLSVYDNIKDAIKEMISDIQSVIFEYEDYKPNVEDEELYNEIEAEEEELKRIIEQTKREYGV